MIKCPFCHFDNEEGALFCEQCKSDLAGAAPTPAVPVAVAMPAEAVPVMAEAVPEMAEAMPLVAEAMPVIAEAEPMVAEAVPVIAEAVPALVEPAVAAPVEPAAVPVAAAVAPPPAPAQPPAAPAEAAPAAAVLGPDAKPRLLVLRGLKRNVEYPIYEGLNFIGRSDDKPVDIDLEDQEPPDRIWCSRQHACISYENNGVEVEDLNSANGTYVNRQRIYPGQKKGLAVNDVVQIGNVQMKLIV